MAAALAPLLAAPLEELGRTLAAFALPPCDGKPDLLHWLPLLNRLDEWLERCASRPDVALRGPATEPFPAADCLAVLRATALLLDFSHNRQLYGSAEVRAPAPRGEQRRGAPQTGPSVPSCVAA